MSQADCVIVDDTGPTGDARKLRISIEDGKIVVLNLNAADPLVVSRPAYGYEKQLFAAATRPPVTDGQAWQTVPREPSDAMLDAASQALLGAAVQHEPGDLGAVKRPFEKFWNAMLAAAPPVEAQRSERVMRDALERLDKFWTEDMGGPDKASLPITEETKSIWRQVRAALGDSSPATDK